MLDMGVTTGGAARIGHVCHDIRSFGVYGRGWVLLIKVASLCELP